MYSQQKSNVFPVTGNPNSQLSGNAAGAIGASSAPDIAWDGSNLWVCTTTGTTSTAVWSMMSSVGISNPVNNLGTISTGTVSLNRATGIVQKLTVGGSLTLSLTGFIAGYSEMLLELINGGSSTITWPNTINWITSTGATTTSFSSYGAQLQTVGTDFIAFFSPDGGTTIFGRVVR